MYDCRITVMRRTFYKDLAEKYENPIEHACDMEIGKVFVSKNAQRPEGF